MEELKSRLKDLFREIFGNQSIMLSEEMTAADIDGWDSLNHIILISAIEKRFKVSFTTKEVVSLNTVGDLIRLLEQKTHHVV